MVKWCYIGLFLTENGIIFNGKNHHLLEIVLLGASGSGTSTLARQLAMTADFHYLDADDYYWLKTERAFEYRRDVKEPNDLLR